MGWTAAFQAALADPTAEIAYQMQVDGSSVVVCSASAVLSGEPRIMAPPRASGGGLTLRAWESTGPRMAVEVAATRADQDRILASWQLGARVEVYALAGGVQERIWLGTLEDIEIGPASIVATLGDAVTLTTSAQTGGGGWPDDLFGDVGREKRIEIPVMPTAGTQKGAVPVVVAYGDHSSLSAGFIPGTSTQVEVIDSSFYTLGWNYVDGRAEGAVQVIPDSGEDPYLVTYQGIDSGNHYLTTAVLLYSTAFASPPSPPFSNAASGSDVKPLGWVVGHPFDVLRGVATSTGTALANGIYDRLPATWGMAYPAEDIDPAELRYWRELCGSDTARFSLAPPRGVESGGMSEVWAWAAGLGIWPVMRHGRLAFRAAVDIDDTMPPVAMEIDDRVIVEVRAQGLRHPDQDHVARDMRVEHYSFESGFIDDDGLPSAYLESGFTTALSAPKRKTAYIDLTRHIRHSTIGPAGSGASRIARLGVWWHRAYPWADVTLVGAAMGLVAGDIVRVSSEHIRGPSGYPSSGAYAMVIPTAWDWGSREVEATLVILGGSV